MVSPTTPTIFVVGSPYPGAMPPSTAGGHVLAVQDDGTFLVQGFIPCVTDEEIATYRGPWTFGIFEDPHEMPGGLPLIGMKAPDGQTFPAEYPFDAALEATKRLDGVLKRVNGELLVGTLVPSLMAVLVDNQTGITCALRLIGPPSEWVKRLGELWLNQPAHGDYYRAYEALISRYSTEELWARATKY